MTGTKRFAYITVDVFTERLFGGNPLAVVTDARGLGTEQMQALAAEFNYSESTFVLPPDDPAHTARVRIFNRTSEMPFAGHPNVGTAYVVALLAERSSRGLPAPLVFEEIAGLVPVELVRDGAGHVQGATLTAPQPVTIGDTLPAAVIATCVGIEASAVVTSRHEPIQASVGLPFVIAEITEDALTRAKPDAAAFADAARRHPTTSGASRSISTRARRPAASPTFARACSRRSAAPARNSSGGGDGTAEYADRHRGEAGRVGHARPRRRALRAGDGGDAHRLAKGQAT